MQRKTSGMTLIEVLVALAIAGIALLAVIKAASQNIRGTAYLQDKSVALWVGQEIMSEVQLGLINLADERSGEAGSEVTMLGKNWYWRATDELTANAHISKLNVRVYADNPDNDATAIIDLDGYRYHA